MTRPKSSLFFLAFVVAAHGRAQTGAVKSAGEPIPGATVSATVNGQRFATVTGSDGRYQLPNVAAGQGTIAVRMFGFDSVSKQAVLGDSRTTIDFALRLRESGAVESPEVLSGSPPSAEPLDTGSSNDAFLVSGSLNQGLLPNAPAGGTDSGQRADAGIGGFPGDNGDFAAGGNPHGMGAGPSDTGRRGFSGGARNRRRGGQPGGAQFGNRRRSNDFHGMVFFSLNNSIWDAKPFSISGQSLEQPAYAQSRYGIVAGGPLSMGKLIHDPATFFSFSYFATRARNPYTAFATTPTPLERAGKFSQPLFDPSTHQPLAGNVIPPSRVDPIAASLLSYIPLPNSPGSVNNYGYSTSVAQNTNNFNLRLQRNITKKDRFAFSLGVQLRDGANAQPFGFLDSLNGLGLTTNLQWTRNLSTHVISAARVTFNRNRSETVPFFAFGPDVAAQFGIAGASSDPINHGPPNLNFTNFGALNDANPLLTRYQSQGFGETVTFIKGRQSFTFGAQFSRNDLNTRSDQNGRGTFNFTGLATSGLDARGLPLPGSGFDFADFLFGLPQSSSIRYGDTSTYFHQDTWAGYLVDDFKPHPRLTLNLGVRYEYFAPLSEERGHIANLDVASGYTAVVVVTPGESGPYTGLFPVGLVNPDRNNFAPRLGLSWKLPGIARSTIVRAGYGIYYNGQIYNSFAAKLAQQPPFGVSRNVNTSPQNVLTLAQGFVTAAPGDVTNTYAVDRFYRTPYAQTWNLSIQHELPRGVFVELGYLGTKGTRLDVQTVPTEFIFDDSDANSIYHALQARVTERFRRGFSFGAFYTFSKSIDDSSSFGGVGNTVAQNWQDLGADRGLSSFDRRHSFSLNWIFTSPVGASGSGSAAGTLRTRLLEEWTFTGSLTAQTGTPLTARVLGAGVQLAQTAGVGSRRADATGLDLSSASGFFNPLAFAVPPAGEFGDAGRNTIPGPGMFALNVSLGRSFQFGDTRRHLELRMEANNVLNHVSYANVDTVVNAINYGAPLSAGAMRSMNIVLRFRF